MSFTKIVATVNKKAFVKPVTPLFSASREQARLRALRLYKQWYRECFDTIYKNELPFTTKEVKLVIFGSLNEEVDV